MIIAIPIISMSSVEKGIEISRYTRVFIDFFLLFSLWNKYFDIEYKKIQKESRMYFEFICIIYIILSMNIPFFSLAL